MSIGDLGDFQKYLFHLYENASLDLAVQRPERISLT